MKDTALSRYRAARTCRSWVVDGETSTFQFGTERFVSVIRCYRESGLVAL